MTIPPDTLALFPMWFVAFLLSLTCHEAAHALAAKWGGDPTAFHGGQVTLNPIPHMRREPFGTILVPLATYFLSGWMMGWASAPYDPHWQQRYPRRAAWMALAGPAANMILVLVAAAAIRAGIIAGIFHTPARANFTHVVGAAPGEVAAGLATFLSIMFSLNLLLCAFNLLPVPPLDGHTAVGLFLKEKTALRFAELTRNPTFMLVGILAAWYLFGYIFDPLFTLGLNLLYPGLHYH
jgi:Zn-dependent protease